LPELEPSFAFISILMVPSTFGASAFICAACSFRRVINSSSAAAVLVLHTASLAHSRTASK